MKHARLFGVIAILSGCQLVAGLTDRSVAGESCVLDSDCALDQVCVFRTCSAICRADRDCEPGSRCLTLEGSAACVSPKAAGCTGPDDCPNGSECVKAECRTGCDDSTHPCRDDQTCTGGVCVGNDVGHDPLPSVGGAAGAGGSNGGTAGSGPRGGSAGQSAGSAGKGGQSAGGAGGTMGGSVGDAGDGGSSGETSGNGGTGGGSGGTGGANGGTGGGSGGDGGTGGGSGGDGGNGGRATGGAGGAAAGMSGSAGAGGASGTGGSSGAGAGAGGSGVVTPPDITSGTNGFMSRYWSCCKLSCSWTANADPPARICSNVGTELTNPDTPSSCSSGSAYACWDFHPWQVSSDLAYGFVAANNPAYACGKCVHVQFTGTSTAGDPGSLNIADKHMIVQVVDVGGVETTQFDLLIPGGGVGQVTSCPAQWGVSASELGAQYGGIHTTCDMDIACINDKCHSLFDDMPELLSGCLWSTSWFQAANSPDVKFEPIACPADLKTRSGLED